MAETLSAVTVTVNKHNVEAKVEGGGEGSRPKERSRQRKKRTGKVTAGKVTPAFVPSLEKLGLGAPISHDTPPTRPLGLSAQAYTHKTVPEEGFVRTQQ